MNKKKNIKRFISLGCILVIVALLAAMPLIAKQTPEEDGPKASILSGTVSLGSIDTELIGGGQLAEDDASVIDIPAAVKLTEFLVSNGDAVTEGTPIASVDRVTVMTAISQVQETLEYLSEQIENAGDNDSEESVTALAGGTVKILYAEKGESVQTVMLEHGALAVLSLDGLMAVDLETDSSLPVGSAVTVTLSDGITATGKVAKNLAGEMTVTLEDDGYAVDDTVQVSAEDGTSVGSGALYIYSPWNATAYAGTVDSINVSVGDTLSAGKTLMVLSDVGYSATYRQLISQRQEYEDLMQELFSMYQTETITAPCDGIVSGVDAESAYLLSDNSGGWVLDLLSFFGNEQHDGFVAYAAQVQSVTENTMTLRMSSQKNNITDLTKLSAVAADVATMDAVWNYSGDITVHTQKENGLLQKSGEAKVGDILLVVGDQEEVWWFVLLDESVAAEQRSPETSHTGNSFVTLLSSEESGEEPPAGGSEEPPAGGSEEPPAGGSEEPPAGGSEEPPAGGSEEPPAGGSEEPPAGGEEPPAGGGETGGAESYLGYVAQVTEVSNGTMKVKQTAYSYTITDLNKLPMVTVDTNALTQEVTYTSELITETAVAVNDYLLVIVEQDGTTLKHFVKQQLPANGGPAGGSGMPGGSATPGFSYPSGGGMGGMGGSMTEQESTFELYGLEMAEIAAVTPQNTMTLDITVDELDITALQIGMDAQVKIDALGGEKHEATITEIGNTGESNGGNSKYTVELTMARTENMLAGMNATATVVLSSTNDVLTIPADALVEQGSLTVVYTGYDEEQDTLLEPVTVTVGTSDGETVEILDGLVNGQTYYYAYYDTLEISYTPDFGVGGFMFG